MAASRVSDLYRTAFITGASTGLGRAFAEMLLADGVRVWGTSRDASRLAELSRVHGSNFSPIALDLRNEAAAADAWSSADGAAEGMHLVINNAGFGIFGEFTEVEFSTWQEQLEVMLIAPARLSHAAVRGMLARNHGALVNISSLAVEFPLPFQSAYNMTKAGLSALSESLMVEIANTGVVVLDVRPGDYRTEFDGSVRRPQDPLPPRLARAWTAFETLMRGGPPPAQAAAELRRALLSRRSGTVRMGRHFQAVVAPFISRFASLGLKRRVQSRYFDV